MNPAPAITVEQVGKAYRLWESPVSRLSVPLLETVARAWPVGGGGRRVLEQHAARRYREFWALRDVSLTIERGESIGIIGRNGSGKSTLLQLIAGTLQPTTGTVRAHGRVAALLELGSGFNPEFTGRENIQLNAAIFGLSRGEIEARFDDIVAFADLGEFIDHPVKTYSSGMAVRLAFAVAAHIDPDILIVDEALAVGDARFQLKCARAIDRFLERGVTLLFVSHDASMVKRLCRRALLLERGQLVYCGLPNDVINLYSKLVAEGGKLEDLADDLAELQAAGARPAPAATPSRPANAGKATPPAPDQAAPPAGAPAAPGNGDDLRLRLKAMETLWAGHPQQPELARRVEELLRDERLHVQVSGTEFSYGGDLGRIDRLELVDADGQARTWFSSGEPVVARMEVESTDPVPEPIFAVTIKNMAGVEIYGTNTLFSNQPAGPLGANERRLVEFAFRVDLMPGHYFLSAGFTHFVGGELVVVHRRYDAIKFEIHGTDRSFGIANLHARITTRTLPAAGGR